MAATRSNHVNVLQHIQGYLKKDLDGDDKQELSETIERYGKGEIPLIVPLTLLKHHFRKCPDPYVDNSYYINPHPQELSLLNNIVYLTRGDSMKTVAIGKNFPTQPGWKIFIGVPLIYLPLLTTVPFMILGTFLVRTHLVYVGGMNIKSYQDFIPDWISHRYSYGDQITYSTGARWYNLRAYKWYWIFNCKLYCPLSVALFRYMAYLVMIVENWWCPFEHDKKADYKEGAIDRSYWHLHDVERRKLHPDDCNNPIWNEDIKKTLFNQVLRHSLHTSI